MATTIVTGNKRTEFEVIVRSWEARYRLARLLIWLPRALAVALVVGIVVLAITRLTGLLTPPRAVIAASISIAISAALSIGITLRPRPLMTAVRYFEHQFGLQERLSTALELLNGRIQTIEDMQAHQLEDAYVRARSIDPKESMKLEIRWREWLALLPLVALLILAIVFFTATGSGNGISAATEQAVADAANDLRDVTETVANDTTLTPEERKTLLETLETSLDTLTDQPLSSEEAFASLQDAEQALRNQAAQMRNNAKAQQEAFDSSAQTLNDVPTDNGGNDPGSSAEDFQKALQQMLDNYKNMSPEQRQRSADALNQAGSTMTPLNDEMAKALEDAAKAMQNGDESQMSQAMNDAIQQAQQMQNSMQSQNQSAQSMENAAQQAQDAARNVARSEQQQSEGQQGQSSDAQQQQNQSGQQQSNDGQPSETGQQQANGDSSQQGQGEGESQSSSDQSAQGDGQPSTSEQGDTPGGSPSQGSDPGQGDQNNAAGDGQSSGGAGDNQASSSAPASGGSGEANTNNNPDGTGESTYDPVYAPQHVTGNGDDQVVLEPDNSSVPVTEGNFQDNPAGQSVVPYNQVFQKYSDAANQALNNDYIPLSLRGVVQDYFTGLEPKK